MMKPKNARFWVFHRGHWVKLTLKPGQSFRHGYSYDNGEGWSYEDSSYEYHEHNGMIYHKWISGGSDCDGRHETTGKRRCHIENLHHCTDPYYGGPRDQLDYFDGQVITRPDWQKVGRDEVYDQFAQSMNY